jgi:hypothetical protein
MAKRAIEAITMGVGVKPTVQAPAHLYNARATMAG